MVIIRKVPVTNMISSLLVLTLVTWLNVFFTFSEITVKLLFFHLSMLYSLERSYLMQPTLRSWRVKLYLLEEAVSTQIVWSSPQQFVFSFLKITDVLAVVGLPKQALWQVLITALGLSLSYGEWGLLFVCELLIPVASLVADTGSRLAGFSSCSAWAQ